MITTGGNVDSVVVDDVVEVSACFMGLLGFTKPATAIDSLAAALRFLASIGDSDELKVPA